MAISAATQNADRIVRSAANNGKSLFEDGKVAVSSSSSWYQGDLICYDTSSKILRVVAATGDAASIVGVADNQVVSGQLNSPYAGLTPVNAAQVSPGFVGPKYGVVAGMKLKTGDTVAVGDKVYLADGQDSQTVSVTDPGDGLFVGICVSAGVTSAPAGTVISCRLLARYPVIDLG